MFFFQRCKKKNKPKGKEKYQPATNAWFWKSLFLNFTSTWKHSCSVVLNITVNNYMGNLSSELLFLLFHWKSQVRDLPMFPIFSSVSRNLFDRYPPFLLGSLFRVKCILIDTSLLWGFLNVLRIPLWFQWFLRMFCDFEIHFSEWCI